MESTRKLVYISIFVTMGTALHMLEALIPNPFPVPGAKLGLANIVTLLALYRYGIREGLSVAFFRVLFGSLLSGAFFSPGFFLSLSGALSSSIVMALLFRYFRSFSIIGVSMTGALFHNIAQLAVASVIIQTAGIYYYLPFLLLFSLPTGFVTGFVSRILLQYLAALGK